MLRNGQCEAMCIDDVKRLCHIRVHADEARLLKAYGELPESTKLNEGIVGGLNDEDEGASDDYVNSRMRISTRSRVWNFFLAPYIDIYSCCRLLSDLISMIHPLIMYYSRDSSFVMIFYME
ncbi:hypothetical protein H6P81_010459 [Aristolochia fimbriata]|uniref:Uncharacterized protein n=1 Tax=Aristolochia fimbriata TaxID=158543 RepID=A0AAV7EPJ9_ARIFI|nr:hypothetical protein H6P81_010459 [Aristolochia fimbriata]